MFSLLIIFVKADCHSSLCYCPSEPASAALWGDRAIKFDADDCMERGKEGPVVILFCAVTASLYNDTQFLCFYIYLFFSRSCVARYVLKKKRRVHHSRGRHYDTNYTMRSGLTTRLARHQSSHQSNTEATTAITDLTWFLKTCELHSSQMLQMIKATSESKALRRGFATLFREQSHHEVKWSTADGVKRCHLHLNQSS
jgi:hypothetical protein